MRYVRIFFLHFQDALQQRTRSFIWFLIALINPLVVLLFWRGILLESGGTIGGWNLSSIASYYMLLIIAGAFMDVHIEEKIAFEDIQEGGLSGYLMRPFSYFWQNFFVELPYRMIQGSFGLIVFILLRLVFGPMITVTNSPQLLLFSICIMVLGFFVSFTFKMIIGISALWMTDYHGLSELIGVIIIIFGGFVLPLNLYPDIMQRIASVLPFSYIFYYPIVAFQGGIALWQYWQIIAVQVFWILALLGAYSVFWNKGIKRFTGIGQ